MSVEIASAYVSLVPSGRGLTANISKELNGLGGVAQKQANGITSVFKRAALGVGAAFAATKVIGLIGDTVGAARESAKIGAQTAQVVKTTGGAANVSAEQIGAYAEKLASLTGIDDEIIQSGENMLLTFTNIRNEVGKGNDIFSQATGLANDMSVALGQDMKSSAMQLGKALNDPVKGVTALQRVGVAFTASQKDQIKTLTESGDVLGAQKIILAELSKEFGGSAAAVATPMQKLKVTLGNLQEQIGAKLLPVIDALAGWLAKRLPGALKKAGAVIGPIAKNIGAFFKALFSGFTEDEGTGVEKVALKIRDVFQNVLLPAISAVAGFVTETLMPAIGKLFGFLSDHKEILVGLAVAIGVGLVAAFVSWAVAAGTAAVATIAAAAPIIAIGVAIAALVAGVIWAYQNWGWFKDAVDAVARFLTETLWPALQSIWKKIVEDVVPAVADFITKVGDFAAKAWEVAGDVKDAFADIAHWVNEKIKEVIRWISTALGPARDLIETLSGLTHFKLPTLTAEDFPFRRAAGGPVRAGRPYIVGEKRPELFVPDVNGTIVPSLPSASGGAMGGGLSVMPGGIVIHAGMGTNQRDLEEAVVRALRGYEQRNGKGSAAA